MKQNAVKSKKSTIYLKKRRWQDSHLLFLFDTSFTPTKIEGDEVRRSKIKALVEKSVLDEIRRKQTFLIFLTLKTI